MIDNFRQKIGLEAEVENEGEQETQEDEVTVPTCHNMLKAMEAQRKGPLFCNVGEWSYCRSLIVLWTMQPKVKQIARYRPIASF